jgi:hemoglobin
MRHAPFAVTPEARKHWLALMGRALEEAQFAPDADRLLRSFFESTAEFLVNRAG